MKLRKVFSIVAMLLIVFLAGCKKDDDPVIRPTVTSTDPINDAAGTAISSNISATFSTLMDPSSITISSFTLQQETESVSGETSYTDSTATFNPAETLAPNTLYIATITTEAKDESGITMLENFTWSFTTGAIPDVALPTVTLTDPVNNATGVAINKLIAVTFSETMDPASITSLTYILKLGSVSVTGAVAYTGLTASFTPSVNLEYNKAYTGTVTTGTKDLAGNTLGNDFIFSFTTVQAPDIILPVINLTDPLNNATGVAVNKVVAITFSEAMDPLTVNVNTFTLMQGTTAVSGAVAYSGTTATFTPANVLTASTVYTAIITTGAKDLAGNTLGNNFIFSFTTVQAPDIILPVINLTDPLNNATGVAVDKVVALTFSEAMDPLTVNANTFTLMQGTTAVSGAVAYSGTTASFTPATLLTASTVYTATITTGAKDLAGNTLGNNFIFSFTTVQAPDIILPVINLTDPLNNATGVAVNKVVAFTFSEAMDPLTVNANTITLMQGTTAVSGAVEYSGTTATFTPANVLTAGTVYTATITTGAKDLAGNSLEANTVVSFTTISATSNLAVVNLGAAGDYVILAKTAITNIPTSAITGDLGLSPAATSLVTGFPLTELTGYATSPQVTGKIYAATMAEPTPTKLTTAIGDMETAYTDAAGRPSPDFSELATGNIGGTTLAPGLYKWTNTVTLPTSITISGSANDVWIFQIAGDLTVSSAVNVTLTGGAMAKNIFWQVAGQVTIGTTSHFEGIILSKTGITLQTGASINGRALAQTAVILDANTVVKPQ